MSVSAIARTISPAILCAACLVLAGCGKKDFDQQYSDKEKQLAAEQAAMQKELDRRMTEKPGLESATPGESPAP